MPRNIEALLFDLDGTLINSEHLHTEAWGILLERFDCRPPTNEWADSFVGLPDSNSRDTVVRLFPAVTAAGDVLAAKQDIFRRLLAEAGASIAMPGVRERLRRLHAAGRPMAVGTNGVLANCRAALEAAEMLEFFPLLVTFDAVENGKPAPDIYLAAAKGLGVPPERCAVFEDSPTGVAAGKAAGCFVVAVETTAPGDRLPGADLVLPDTAAAIDWFMGGDGGETYE